MTTWLDIGRRARAAHIAMLLGTIALSGCEAARSEFRQSGGIADYHADAIMPVQHREDQLYRATVAMSLLSAVGYRTVEKPDDAWDFVYSLERTADQINAMGMLLRMPDEQNTTPASADDCADFRVSCRTYPAQFEDLLPDLERRLFKLTVAVVPRQQFGDVAEDIVSGNYVALAVHLLRLTRTVLDAAHQGAAHYRSVVTGIAYAIARTKGETTRTFRTVEEARPYVAEFFKEGQTPDKAKPLTLQPQDWEFLYVMARRYCAAVALRTGEDATAGPHCTNVAHFASPDATRRTHYRRFIGG